MRPEDLVLANEAGERAVVLVPLDTEGNLTVNEAGEVGGGASSDLQLCRTCNHRGTGGPRQQSHFRVALEGVALTIATCDLSCGIHRHL